jgi:hypothetical protein
VVSLSYQDSLERSKACWLVLQAGGEANDVNANRNFENIRQHKSLAIIRLSNVSTFEYFHLIHFRDKVIEHQESHRLV